MIHALLKHFSNFPRKQAAHKNFAPFTFRQCIKTSFIFLPPFHPSTSTIYLRPFPTSLIQTSADTTSCLSLSFGYFQHESANRRSEENFSCSRSFRLLRRFLARPPSQPLTINTTRGSELAFFVSSFVLFSTSIPSSLIHFCFWRIAQTFRLLLRQHPDPQIRLGNILAIWFGFELS